RLGAIIGLSAPTVSRLRSGAYRLEPGSKPFELAQHLLRLFRSLDSWLGQDDDAARSWLATPNLDLGAAPIDLVTSVRGLLRTGDYVDALRARV
ncbi:MbcA/ParS/Xre antitoxin family protein, partial [Clostridium perfringens]